MLKNSFKISKKKETLARRKQLLAKVYTLKIDNKSINKNTEYFKMLFLEAKWLYNFLLSQENIFKINTKDIKIVKVKLFDGSFEERKLEHLSSQMKQALLDKLKDNIKALSKSKKSGNKIGYIKFKREINNIILKQFNATFKIKDNKLYLQSYKKGFKVHGLKQLASAKEFGCGRLIKKPSGIYLQITCYKDKIIPTENRLALGIDFNISNTLTFSNGQQIDNISIKESKRLKKLQRDKEKKVKGSNNRLKINNLIAKEYEHISNQKKDIANKIINKLKLYQLIIQDDNLSDWHKGYFGKSIQHSVLGRIKSRIINLETSIVIGQFERTTNTCFNCGYKLDLKLGDKEFTCPICGHSDFRDRNAAKNILKIGLEQSKLTPLESEEIIDFSSIKGIKIKNLTLKKEDSIIYVE